MNRPMLQGKNGRVGRETCHDVALLLQLFLPTPVTLTLQGQHIAGIKHAVREASIAFVASPNPSAIDSSKWLALEQVQKLLIEDRSCGPLKKVVAWKRLRPHNCQRDWWLVPVGPRLDWYSRADGHLWSMILLYLYLYLHANVNVIRPFFRCRQVKSLNSMASVGACPTRDFG